MTNHGSSANAYVPPALDMAAFDRLPAEIRHFISVFQLRISPALIEQRLLVVHRGSIEGWISEAENVFPRFRDSVVTETWGNDHPSIDGPILEDDYVVSRRPPGSSARQRAGLR